MTPRPPIFISAVSRELRSARQLVANTLTFLGYQPIWQDIFGTESGDLRELLRQQIDQCKGVVQLVGPPGQVYASEAFAALAAAQHIRDFTCDYVGQTPMAKGYGTSPAYHVRPRTPALHL